MSAAPLDTKRSPGETFDPGKLTTTELRLLSWSLKTETRSFSSLNSFSQQLVWYLDHCDEDSSPAENVKHRPGSRFCARITEFLSSFSVAEIPPALSREAWDEHEKNMLWKLSVACRAHALDGCWLLEGDSQSMCASYNPLGLLFIVRNRGLGWKNTDLPFSLGQSSHSRRSQVFWLILCCCTFGINAE